jgi:hypothetical protein
MTEDDTMNEAEMKSIAKDASERAAKNTGVAPELLYAPILWTLEDRCLEETWTITCRRRWPERISFALALLFSWPVDLERQK